jgi:hypothetical protein
MAATYSLLATAQAWTASAAYKLSLFNGAGSGVVLRVYRIWLLNAQTAGITGVTGLVELRRLTAGATFTPTGCAVAKHDSNSSDLPAAVIFGSAGTVTPGATIRRVLWTSDEPAANTAVVADDLQAMLPLALIWDTGYGDNNVGVEPITLVEGEGISLYAAAFSAAGNSDYIIEFTSGAS